MSEVNIMQIWVVEFDIDKARLNLKGLLLSGQHVTFTVTSLDKPRLQIKRTSLYPACSEVKNFSGTV